MFLLLLHGSLNLLINLPLILNLSNVLALHLFGLWRDHLLHKPLLRVLRELLKPLLSFLHHFRMLLPLLKVRVLHDCLLVVHLFDDLGGSIADALLELALHDVLRLLLPEPVPLVLLLALDLLGLLDRSHHRDPVLLKLSLPLLVFHTLLLVQDYLELLPYHGPAVSLYLTLLHLLLLKLL